MDSEAPMSAVRDEFGFELVKLLLQFVWADEEVSSDEDAKVREFATQLGVGPAHADELTAYLSGAAPLPPPNLAVLKPRKVEVLRAVRQLLHALGQSGDAENELVTQISALLR